MRAGAVILMGLAAQSVVLYAAAAPAPPKPAAPAPISREAEEFFEKRVRPVLVENCFSCHGTKSQFAGLRVDSLAAMLKGTDLGKTALVPGDPAKSPLIQVLSHTGGVKMPPQGKLPAADIEALTAWVKMGAPWPGAGAAAAPAAADPLKHWSFQPIRKARIPSVKAKAWVKNPIDSFVLAKLEAKGLQPAKAADRRSLIRRVTFDLTGLPPTTREISDFVADTAPNAWEKVVDRLLASPHYGERWGRKWLDVARYSDTLGYLVQPSERRYPYAYTYRDYVIRAFNEDKPYNQFVKEQLAADQLELKDRRDLAALGFLTVGSHFLNSRQEIIDDRIDVVTRGFQAMTVQCARCHDHKYDPIPTADYYSLYAVFDAANEPGELPKIGEAPDPKSAQAFEREYSELQKKIADMRAEKKDVGALERQAKALLITHAGSPPRAMVLADNPNPGKQRIFLRGNPGTPGDEVPRQYLRAVEGPDRKPFTKGSGRLELAETLVAADNPLTSRVLVNRLWMGHFGRGLVATPSDFGLRGEAPTHPELLDWLATVFMSTRQSGNGSTDRTNIDPLSPSLIDPHGCGWSLKKLHRLMLLSNTYQQSSEGSAATVKADPENRLVGRFNRQRLDFEELRDAMLAVSGELDATLYGRSVNVVEDLKATRRTVYAFIDRQDLPTLLRTFDYPDANAHAGQRFSTIVPQQSLFLMNNAFVHDRARGLLARPGIGTQKTGEEKIRQLYRVIFGRSPAPEEVTLGLSFLKKIAAEKEAPVAETTAWQYGYGEYDPSAKKLKAFVNLPHFSGQSWQGGPQIPDPKIGWVFLNPQGGHPGNDLQHSAIRRWVAPRDMTVRIRGTVQHPSDQGDGVQALVVSSRAGMVGSWVAKNSSAQTAVDRVDVKRGDTIDFVLECRTSPSFDGFTWAPSVEVVTENGPGGFQSAWSASADFAGPAKEQPKPLTPWEAYAQALLLTNEFIYID
ncbi:MAG: PSD1 and planctomycete cytochrome C domain-containing protein [Actinomycetota bacterium]